MFFALFFEWILKSLWLLLNTLYIMKLFISLCVYSTILNTVLVVVGKSNHNFLLNIPNRMIPFHLMEREIPLPINNIFFL